jgi:methylated-DNA-[protein]-cysteine S-methyltransferase
MEFINQGMNMRYYDTFQSPHGRMLLVATEDGVSGVYFVGQKYFPAKDDDWKRSPGHAPLKQVKRELAEYFAGRRKRFAVALDPDGTPFQRSVWKAISTVSFGKTIAYAELASKAGFPGSARAAGAATGRNPISILVPCHRIVGSDGSLTGYAGGLRRKRALLALERAPGAPQTRTAAMR